MNDSEKKVDLAELEKTKDEILRRIAERVKANSDTATEFGASHTSHSSHAKHSSTTG